MRKPTVSIIGLGKLGAPIAASYAAHGFTTIGVDIRPEAVEAIASGKAPVEETGLQELLDSCRDNLSATTSITEAVEASHVTFIVVATPSTAEGGFSLDYVLPVLEEVGAAVRGKAERHLVVLTSTVMPGASESDILPTLVKAADTEIGPQLGYCYSPEFIALGSVINDFTNPDFVLIGEADEQSGNELAAIYQQVCDNKPPAARMNVVNAEIAKLALNTYCTTKITFANTLARLCERIPGADVDTVADALGNDSRIGRKYLTGAIGYGGPCFPRDTIAFETAAAAVGVDAATVRATDAVNRQQAQAVCDLATQQAAPGATVGILGLAYKPDTDVVEESQALEVIQHLLAQGYSVVAFDPLAMEQAQHALPPGVSFAASAADCITQASVVIIMTDWREFQELPASAWANTHIIDCWRTLRGADVTEAASYLPLGSYHPATVSAPATR